MLSCFLKVYIKNCFSKMINLNRPSTGFLLLKMQGPLCYFEPNGKCVIFTCTNVITFTEIN